MSRISATFTLLILGQFLGVAAGAQDITRSNPRFTSGGAGGDARVALVIGNGGYQSQALATPVHDARSVADLLRSLNFRVQELTNGDLRAMKGAIRAFAQNLQSGSVGIFYYAGHAIQVHGDNYLLPLAADIQDTSEVANKTVPLRFLFDQLGESVDRLNVVILEACHNNPFPWSREDQDQGLARVDAPIGTLLAYAAAPEAVAHEGRGGHGVFTEHLLKALKIPGLKIEEVLKETREVVSAATNTDQVPWISNSLVRDFVPVTDLRKKLLQTTGPR